MADFVQVGQVTFVNMEQVCQINFTNDGGMATIYLTNGMKVLVADDEYPKELEQLLKA